MSCSSSTMRTLVLSVFSIMNFDEMNLATGNHSTSLRNDGPSCGIVLGLKSRINVPSRRLIAVEEKSETGALRIHELL